MLVVFYSYNYYYFSFPFEVLPTLLIIPSLVFSLMFKNVYASTHNIPMLLTHDEQQQDPLGICVNQQHEQGQEDWWIK